jgi:hypothetical protein
MVTTGSVCELAHWVHGGEDGEPSRASLAKSGAFVPMKTKLTERRCSGLYRSEHRELLECSYGVAVSAASTMT